MAKLQVTPSRTTTVDVRDIASITSESLGLVITITYRTLHTSVLRFTLTSDFLTANSILENELLEYRKTLDSQVSGVLSTIAKDSLNTVVSSFNSRLDNILSSISKEFEELRDKNYKLSGIIRDFDETSDALKWVRSQSTKEDFGKLQEVITSLAGILKE